MAPNTPPPPDPVCDEVAASVIAALTCVFSEDTPGAEQELADLKEAHAEAAVDFLFGGYYSMIQQFAAALEIDPMQMVRVIAIQAAQVGMGIDPEIHGPTLET